MRFINIAPAEILYGTEFNEIGGQECSPERWGAAFADAILPDEPTTKTAFMQSDPNVRSLCNGLSHDRDSIKLLIESDHPDYPKFFSGETEIPVGEGGIVVYCRNWQYIGSLCNNESLDIVFPSTCSDEQVATLLKQQLGEDHWIFK